MRRILIYDTSVSGHHMEYIHHIYMATEGENAEFVFVIPEEFLNQKEKLIWPKRNNVSFDLIPQNKIQQCSGGVLKLRWNQARLSNYYIRKHNVDEVFFIELILQIPFLPLLAPRNVNISGILYQLMPYEWEKLSLLAKLKNGIEIFTYAKSKKVKAPMTLNDSSCACYYNHLFKTNKFKPVVDPVMKIGYAPKCIRNTFDLKDDDKMFLHFGEMSVRKGTLLILEAMEVMTSSQLDNKKFVFAGRVSKEIKNQFYQKIEKLKGKAKIYVYDQFCSYEFLADLCKSCNCIIIPYENYSYSSGVIGYSAQFQKPVLGPSKGILGKLIRRNRLGTTFSDYNAESLAKALMSNECFQINESNYTRTNTAEAFSTTILNILLRN